MNISHRIPETEAGKDWLFGHLVCSCQCRTAPHGTFMGNKACRIKDYLTFYCGSQCHYCISFQSIFPVYTKLASALPFSLPPRNVASLCKKTRSVTPKPRSSRVRNYFLWSWLNLPTSETFLKNRLNQRRTPCSTLANLIVLLEPRSQRATTAGKGLCTSTDPNSHPR